MEDKKPDTETSDASVNSSQARRWSKLSFEKKLSLVFVPIMVALIAIAPSVLGAMFGDDGFQCGPSSPITSGIKQEVPRFNGVVGNFEESRASISFLEDNDGGPVELDEVGFPEVALHYTEDTSDAPNYGTIDIPMPNGTGVLVAVTYVRVWTDCNPPIPDWVEPSRTEGCVATSFQIEGKDTADAQTFLTYGVPVYDDFFRVDDTGVQQMGVSPIHLTPLTREEATTG